jgi:SET domain-containing protein
VSEPSTHSVEVKSSPIEGQGVFALRPFRAGEQIRRVQIVREVTEDAPIRAEAGERVEHCGYPDGKVVLWGFPDRHLNHSCDPNAYEHYEAVVISIVARRDIASGEEVTVDYNVNTSGGNSWPCRCGAARCRGESVGDFFALPREQQHEYRSLLATWFVRRHRERLRGLDAER